MKNIEELRSELISVFDKLKIGKLKTKDAKELINCSGKILLSTKVQLDYNKFMEIKKRIDFLETDEK